jgi:ParB-like chromosome segregation protein Spo0J
MAADQAKGKGRVRILPLKSLKVDYNLQARAGMSRQHVEDLKAAYERGDDVPPLTVFFDGNDHWLAGGFHRFDGAHNAKIKEIRCLVFSGTKRDALLFACGDNATHGMPRTDADKELAVSMLLC